MKVRVKDKRHHPDIWRDIPEGSSSMELLDTLGRMSDFEVSGDEIISLFDADKLRQRLADPDSQIFRLRSDRDDFPEDPSSQINRLYSILNSRIEHETYKLALHELLECLTVVPDVVTYGTLRLRTERNTSYFQGNLRPDSRGCDMVYPVIIPGAILYHQANESTPTLYEAGEVLDPDYNYPFIRPAHEVPGYVRDGKMELSKAIEIAKNNAVVNAELMKLRHSSVEEFVEWLYEIDPSTGKTILDYEGIGIFRLGFVKYEVRNLDGTYDNGRALAFLPSYGLEDPRLFNPNVCATDGDWLLYVQRKKLRAAAYWLRSTARDVGSRAVELLTDVTSGTSLGRPSGF